MTHEDCAGGECQACWQFYPIVAMGGNLPPEVAANALAGHTVVGNRYYTVFIKRPDETYVHLSIKRNDKAPTRDWRHFQRIKNMLLGPEAEAVELFPAESRLVDNANQSHLWCIAPGQHFPLGWWTRLVTKGGDSSLGAKQRHFPAWAEPADALSVEEADAKAREYFSKPRGTTP